MSDIKFYELNVRILGIDFYEFCERFGIICDNYTDFDIKNDEKTDFIKKITADMLKKEQLNRLGAKKLL